jgi:hypothetical protein
MVLHISGRVGSCHIYLKSPNTKNVGGFLLLGNVHLFPPDNYRDRTEKLIRLRRTMVLHISGSPARAGCNPVAARSNTNGQAYLFKIP